MVAASIHLADGHRICTVPLHETPRIGEVLSINGPRESEHFPGIDTIVAMVVAVTHHCNTRGRMEAPIHSVQITVKPII